MVARLSHSAVHSPCTSNSTRTPLVAAHAGYSPQCAQENPPSWCSDSWCYVDPDSCDKPSKLGTLSSDLYYSYEACGFVDIYSPSKIDSKQKIRFTYMGEEFYRIFSEPVVQSNGRTIKAWRGVMPEFFTRIVELMGLENTVEVPLTQASIDYAKYKFNTSSAYTACAAMIATNGTDWCVGDVSSITPPPPPPCPCFATGRPPPSPGFSSQLFHALVNHDEDGDVECGYQDNDDVSGVEVAIVMMMMIVMTMITIILLAPPAAADNDDANGGDCCSICGTMTMTKILCVSHGISFMLAGLIALI